MNIVSTIKKLRPFTNIHESYKTVFETPDGQKVLKHMMRVGYVDSCPYVPGDPHESSHRMGMQRFVLSILKQLRMSTGEIKNTIEEMQDDDDDFLRG